MDSTLTIEMILKQYRFNLVFAEKLVDDIPQELMSKKAGAGLENHPSFTLGHLVTASAMTVEDLGGTYKIPDGWNELFLRKGPGDPRIPGEDSALYPSKEILLKELAHQHDRVEKTLLNTDAKTLMAPIKWRFNKYFPTTLDLVAYMCISHENIHLSQLSAWRRAMGFASAYAEL